MLDALVVFAPEQVETGGQGVSGILVEVVSGHFVLRVINEVDTLQDILLDETIALGHALTILRTAIIHIDDGLGLGHVGNAHILLALCIILISLSKDVQQGEMQPGTKDMRLAPRV